MDTFLTRSNSFSIEPTKTTPYVAFHSDRALLEIRGVSSPNNTPTFYAPIFTFLENLSSFNIGHLNLQIGLLYFNSSTAKALFTILKNIKSLPKSITYTVEWFCDEDDEDMIESVQDFNDILNMNIKLIIDTRNG